MTEKKLSEFQTEQARKHGYNHINHARSVLTDGTPQQQKLLQRILYDAQDAYVAKYFPVQDSIWPSRRWNAEGTTYMDMSGY